MLATSSSTPKSAQPRVHVQKAPRTAQAVSPSFVSLGETPSSNHRYISDTNSKKVPRPFEESNGVTLALSVFFRDQFSDRPEWLSIHQGGRQAMNRRPLKKY